MEVRTQAITEDTVFASTLLISYFSNSVKTKKEISKIVYKKFQFLVSTVIRATSALNLITTLELVQSHHAVLRRLVHPLEEE